ncbi:MAG: VCBS repeat-containing protein [Planctomycetota bacterium]
MPRHTRLRAAGGAALLLLIVACAPEYRPCWLGGNCADTVVAGSVFLFEGQAFSEVLLQERTFVQGRSVTTVTHRTGDLTRRPVLIDFNADGRVDPVVAYAQERLGVIQILLSHGPPGTTEFFSLTLDGGENAWQDLADVAVGDIDGDGNLDLVAATAEGVVYLHHPAAPDRTHVLSEWGAPTGAAELINGTGDQLTDEELMGLIAQAIGVGANLDNYIVTVTQGYTSVEIADFDRDGANDIAASRRLRVDLQPKPDIPLSGITIVAGSMQLLINPGAATTGADWTGVIVGQHERHATFDRDGARELRACDVDRDGDFDLVSAATDDNNVQIAWFENPGGGGYIDPLIPWAQRRIGSARGATAIEVADLNGDGRADVAAASPEQMQLLLFLQPDSVADRGYDWYGVPIVTFTSFEPRAVTALDVDLDGALELVVGGSEGTLRYFEPPLLSEVDWAGHVITDFDPVGDVGGMGYGDFDGDGDLDLIVPLAGSAAAAERVVWVRNELIPSLPPGLAP